MAATSIEWTDFSVNPIRARLSGVGEPAPVGHYCEKISSGCANCYASAIQKRFGMPTFKGNGLERGNVELFLDESKLEEVLRRRKPTKWFWCDMSDLFGEWVSDEWIDKCFAVMAMTPHHTHQILSKRPERMAEYLLAARHPGVWDEIQRHLGPTISTDTDVQRWCDLHKIRRVDRDARRDAIIEVGGFYFPDGPGARWPSPNVWLGTSVENQAAADERIPHLLRCPAAVRFLSVEPLLEPIQLPLGDEVEEAERNACGQSGCGMGDNGQSIDWVIVGGESGPQARPCPVEWIESIIAQCKAAGVPCFVKQLGARPIICDSETSGMNVEINLRDKKGGDPSEWPEELRVREYPRPASVKT